ncbi:MAG: VWA domain-containing protein [Phycisphaerales bacterium]|nr:VWA domain-containing protein [Phycisphaerales bacterium]MCB9858553.1 VWA domain-containing protein [Phycisphaerales bacterium]
MSILAQGYRTVANEEVLEFARWSAGNALIVGGLVTLIGAYAVIWLYRHEGRGRMSPRLRWALTGLRLLALVAIGVIALEPVYVRYEERRQDATTIVLVDSSASMGLSDHYRNETNQHVVRKAMGDVPPAGLKRIDIATNLLGPGGSNLLKALAQDNRVRLLSFDRTSNELETIERAEPDTEPADSAAIVPAISATGSATDPGQAIRHALESANGGLIAGVVVLTDGRFNRGEHATQLARAIRGRDIPLFAVGVGDPAEPVNLRVAEISAPRSAFKNDPFRVSAKLEAVGMSGTSVVAELWERREGRDESKRVDQKRVEISSDGVLPMVVFERKVDLPGDVGYTLRLAPADYEAVLTDNERDLVPGVRILDDRMKVLLVSGGPSFDYRFLSRLLERDKTVELSTWLQSADINAVRDGNVVLEQLPVGTEEINKYDAVILMDVDPRELDPTWASVLATYVSEYGGGVLYAAGNKYTGSFFRSPKTKPIVSILPIVPDPEAEIIINELGHYQMQAWPIVVTDEAAGDPILRQTDRVEDTRDAWALLGGVYWHYPVRREKPVAKALMRHSNPRMVNSYGPHVLYATQYVGAGRSAYLGINTTWRWRQGDEKPFNRFWIQTLRFLVEGKLLGGRARGQILVSQDTYEVGDTVVVTARALTESFEPLLLPQLNMIVRAGADSGEARDVELVPIPGREGHYEGRIQVREQGATTMSIQLPSANDTPDRTRDIEKSIFVTEPNLEMRDTPLDESGLAAFAEAAGGRYLSVAEAAELPQLIQDRSRTARHRGRTRPAWDHSTVFAGLLLVLTAEWILRKVAKLI